MVRKANHVFILGAAAFVLLSLLWIFSSEQGDAIRWFAARRSDFADQFFIFITKIGEELSYVVVLLFLLWYRYRHALMILVLGAMVPVVSLLSKGLFSQPRPKKYFMLEGSFDQIELVEGVALYTGNTSFPSGHTMSAFALFGFFAFALHYKKWFPYFAFCLALLVALSRVYLVQHFLKDVCAGAFLGSSIALCVSWISTLPSGTRYPWLDRNLRDYIFPNTKA